MDRRAVVRPVDFQGRRVLVVSDIHGALPLLKGALDKARFSQEDVLIVLGDMMERSEGSLDTLRYVMELSRTHTVHTVLGNCDNVTLGFFDGVRELPSPFYQRWFPRFGPRCALVRMAELTGVSLEDPADWPDARAAMARAFAPELDFLRSLPHILLHRDYLFVHGGVPREDRLTELSAYEVMKNDAFLDQGRGFRRWVIVGHWPVTLYNETVPSAAPILLPRRRVVSIDGGATLKLDGQVNVLILPETPEGAFTWVSDDGLPTVTALDPQAASEGSINIRYGHSDLEVLERGPEVSWCRHLESGRTLWVLTEFLRRREDGSVWCEDSTDYLLPVSPGETLSLVRKTSYGILAKKDGVTGWYRGRWR